jgi:hypothetical protein
MLFSQDGTNKFYFPCGAIANSMFSDVLKVSKDAYPVHLNKSSIAWEEELSYKFKNPLHINKDTYSSAMSVPGKVFLDAFTKPQEWTQTVWEDWWQGGGLENPDFVNWMHPSASRKVRKSFRGKCLLILVSVITTTVTNMNFMTHTQVRKLYGIIEEVTSCQDKTFLCPGTYEVNIDYRMFSSVSSIFTFTALKYYTRMRLFSLIVQVTIRIASNLRKQ